MSQGSRSLLVSLLAGLWDETGNAAAFDDEIAALCREAKGIATNAGRTPEELRWCEGRRVLDARKALRLTQQEDAARIGTTGATISGWETGTNYCDADVVIAAMRDPEHNKLPRRFVAPKPRKEDRP